MASLKDELLSDYKNTAKSIIEECVEGQRIVGERFYLVNTTHGAREYGKAFKRSPEIRGGWVDTYGHLESKGSKHFIFLADVLVQNWIEGDIVATIIHEIFHAPSPNDPEERIKQIENPDNQIAEMSEANNQKDLAFTVGSTTVTTTVTSQTTLPAFTVNFYADPSSGTLTADHATMTDQTTVFYSSGQRCSTGKSEHARHGEFVFILCRQSPQTSVTRSLLV